MRKQKFYKIVDKINNGDQFSNIKAGLEDDNIFSAVTEEPTSSLDSLDKEVETQLPSDEDGEGFKFGKIDEEEFDDENSWDFEEDEKDDFDDDEDEKNEWDEAESDLNKEMKKDPVDCINLMEIVSGYTNNYRKLFVEIGGKKIVETTGEFTQHPKYADLSQMFDDLSGMYSGTKNEYFNNLDKVNNLLHQSKKMISICGTDKAPFLYEGIQLAYISQLHNMFMATPYTLSYKATFDEAIESVGFDKDIKFFDRILLDIIESAPALGTKIQFEESSKNDVTGKDETIGETVYNDSDLISEGHDVEVTDFEYASESIQNLINIKANKALLEYNVLIRDCSLLVTYLDEYEPKDNWETIRKVTYTLLQEEDTTKIENLLATTCNTLNKILVKMSKAYQSILKEKNND